MQHVSTYWKVIIKLDSQHNYNPIEQSMNIFNKGKKRPKLNTLERYYVYDLTRKGLQLN
jgi:hypothetical protein